MILLLAVVLGLVAAQVRGGLRPPHLRYEWLALVGFLPQLILFSRLGQAVPLPLVAMGLVGSQCVLLVFVWLNRHTPYLLLLGLGLFLNMAVIVANGGLMPISPEMAHTLTGGEWLPGQRFGLSKDMVLSVSDTRLWRLSDRFLLPIPGYYVAYSLGDIFIALGAFLFLYSLSERKNQWELA